jgi:hypothetical protein
LFFERSLGWKKTCGPCWYQQRKLEEFPPPDADAELRGWQEEALRLRCQLQEAITAQKSSGIEPEMLGRLIRLCHPDKHNGSEAANTATQWLLAQREART